jgi:peptidyl-Lys metalloendopeptidase
MTHRTRLLAAVAVVAAVVAVQAMAAPGLVSRLEIGAYQNRACDEIALTYTLTNTTDHDLYVLRWQTPLHGISGDIFLVQRDGEAVTYTGRLYKWATPRAEDYVAIPAGETLSVVLDPSAAYDMSVTGQYTMRYRAVVEGVRSNGSEFSTMSARDTSTVESNEVAFFVEGRERAPYTPEEGAALDGPAVTVSAIGGYTSCTSSQKTALSTALTNAGTIATKAYNHLVAYPSGSTLYTTWFGTYLSSRFSTVKTHYTNLKSTFASKTFTFDCSCTDSAYAYVYPTQPYKVYLCKAYWSAPAMGRDSKAGTLVHETSHFNVVAGTQDYVYGATGAKNLAKSTPSKAIMNADNHEYFAEDQP